MSPEYKPVPKIPTSETKKSQVNQVDFTKYLSNEAKLKLGIKKVESKKDLLIGAADLTLAADLKQEAETTNSNKLNLPIPTTELVAPTIGEKKDVGLTKMQAEANRNLAAAKARNEAILKKLNEIKAEKAKLTPQPKASLKAVVTPQSKPEVTKAQATSTQHVETAIGGRPLSVSTNSEKITPMTAADLTGQVSTTHQLAVAPPTPKTRGIMGSLSKFANYFNPAVKTSKTEAKVQSEANLEHQKQVDKAVEQNSVTAYKAAAKELTDLHKQTDVDNDSIKATTFTRDGQLILKFEIVPNGQGNLKTVNINTVTVRNPDNSTTVSTFYTVNGQDAASIAISQYGPDAVVAKQYSLAR